jgi:hypothetical protein
LWVGVGAVAAVIVLAIIKPWDTAPAGSARSPLPVAPASAPVVAGSAPASPAAPPSRARCFSREGWRLVTLERTETSEIRTWVAVAPERATGPNDPDMPSVRVVAGRLEGLGFCAPEAVSPALGVLWVLQGEPRAFALASLESLDGVAEADHGVAFAPPDELRQGEASWPTGGYAFEIRPAGTTRSLWFAFRVLPAPSRIR